MRNKERELVPPGGMNGRIVPRQDWGTIPKYTLEALIDYVEHGRPVGSFLYAVVAGDLFGAFRGADNRNRHCIGDIIRWLRNVPLGCCYGSEARVAAWMAMTPMQRSVVLERCPTWQDFMEEWESGDDGAVMSTAAMESLLAANASRFRAERDG